MKKFKLLLGLLLFSLHLFSTNYQANTLSGFEEEANKARAGDTIALQSGSYSGGITLDKNYPNEVVFVFDGVKIDGTDDARFTLDLKGKNITFLMLNSEVLGGREAGIGVRGDYVKIIGENTLVKDNNFGLVLVGTHHHVEGLVFRGQRTGGIIGNNLKLDPVTREVKQGFYRGPANHWRITRCQFYDIAPFDPGNAGGGIRLIPYVKSIIIDNCHFEGIKGNALWFDHGDDDVGLYYNSFKDIELKCIFLEIFDPNPAFPIKGIKVAGNYGRGNQRHGVFIAASSNVEVWGNSFDGWPFVAHGMPRPFKRRFDPNKPENWEVVNGQLKNISFWGNEAIVSTGRNHFMVYNGPGSGNNKINGNYYVVGNNSLFRGREEKVDNASFFFGNGKFLHERSITGLGPDPNGQTGPQLTAFPYPDVFDGIPVQRYARSDIPDIDFDPDTIVDDPVIDDSTTTPSVDTDRPRVWIVSDLSSERTDKDDRVASAMVLSSLDYINLQGWTVGAHKWNLPNALTWFNQNLSNAYQQEQPALNATYGGFPEVLPMHQASTTGKGFKKGLESLEDYPSVKALYEAAQKGKLYVLLWGPGGEVATMLEYASRQTDQSAFLNTIVITHASSPKSLNNCARDAAACEYLHDLAKSGKLKLYELGFAGKVIDDKTFPKIGNEVLKSKIGSYLKEKWQAEKPDGSDAITLFIFIPELGGGEAYILTLKSDGTSNMAKIMTDFTKQDIYDHLIKRFKVAASGKTDNEPDPDKGEDPVDDGNLKEKIYEVIDILLEIANSLK